MVYLKAKEIVALRKASFICDKSDGEQCEPNKQE